jgi:hypothetical protein
LTLRLNHHIEGLNFIRAQFSRCQDEFMTLQSYTDANPSLPLPTHVRAPHSWEKSYYISAASRFEPSTWVKLLNPPTAFSFDEAWLLCQCSEQDWLAWIPDYGEIMLRVDEFCNLPE